MRIAAAALLLRSVSCAIIFQSLWPAQDCEGPPSVMYRFQIYGRSGQPLKSDVNCPAAFYTYSSYIPAGFTSLGPAVSLSPKQSCVSWLLDSSLVDNYPSSAYDNWDYTMGDAIPTGANGYNYCVLKPASLDNFQNFNLYGRIAMYIREGKCADGLTCATGGVLTVNTTKLCGTNSSNTASTTLDSNTQLFQNQIGPKNFTANFIPITQANVNMIWKSYVPANLLYPTFMYPAEIIGIFCLFLSIVFMLLGFIYYLVRYVMRNYSAACLYPMVGQMIWLLSNIAACVSLSISFQNLASIAISNAMSSSLRAFATFFGAIYTTNFLLGVKAASQIMRYIAFGTVFLVHIALCGACYLTWVPFVLSNNSAQAVIDIWIFQFIWWVMLVFILMLSPSMYLIYKVVLKQKGQGGQWIRFKKNILSDTKSCLIIIFMFTFMSLWMILRGIGSLNPVLFGGDRVRIACISIRELFISIPFLLNCSLMDHIPILISRIKSKKSKKESQINESKSNKKSPALLLKKFRHQKLMSYFEHGFRGTPGGSNSIPLTDVNGPSHLTAAYSPPPNTEIVAEEPEDVTRMITLNK